MHPFYSFIHIFILFIQITVAESDIDLEPDSLIRKRVAAKIQEAGLLFDNPPSSSTAADWTWEPFEEEEESPSLANNVFKTKAGVTDWVLALETRKR